MRKRRSKKRLTIPAMLVSALIAWLSYSAQDGFVTKVVDGDTIHVGKEKIRLIGINTPEIAHQGQPTQCFGLEAKEFLESKVMNKKVVLENDPQTDEVDKYGRSLRYVSVDGELINRELVRQGYAFAYTRFKAMRRDEFKQLENEARAAKRGLWAVCNVTCKNDYCRTQ